jgi:subtilase family serine protease
MSLSTRTVVSVLGVAAVIGAATAGTGLAASSPGKHALTGSVPPWAQAAQKVGASDKNARVDFRVYLASRGGDAAAQLATAVSTPGSAGYGKFLTPAQYRARFAPAQSDVDAVSSWLRSQGFTVGYVPANRKYVEAVGSVGQATAAFGTSFFDYTVKGKKLRANATPLAVPDSLGHVQAVLGLDDSGQLVQHHATYQPPAGFRVGQPCSAYWSQKVVPNAVFPDGGTSTPAPDGTALPTSPSAYAPCGYAGAQLQNAYGVGSAIKSGNDGTGVTVAVIDAFASPTAGADLARYSREHGLPAPKLTEQVAPGIYNHPTTKKWDPSGWAGEEQLDLEAVHTMAPGANILYVGAPNNGQPLDAALNSVVDKHSADIVTNSYGWAGEALPPGYITPQVDIQIQAAATGISVFYSSGDAGDETGGVPGATPSPDFPASSPWVTAVGGTSLGVSKANTREFEVGWETGRSTLNGGPAWSTPQFQYGSGGGTSRLFAQPSYQAGVVPASMSQRYGGAAMRVVPDVSALGDPNTGMRVGQTQTFPDGSYYDEYRIGGTSLSSPLYAGMFALAVQKHGPYGLANPTLYGARGLAYDITKAPLAAYPGDVRVDYKNGVDPSGGYSYTARWFDYDQPLTIHVRPGYDDVTGVGSPNGSAWLSAVQH